jgi:hypothetical protein
MISGTLPVIRERIFFHAKWIFFADALGKVKTRGPDEHQFS